MKDFIVAVDFDGTIVKDRYPDIGDPIPGAEEALNLFKYNGIKIIIWTCRTGEQADQAKKYLIDNKIPFDYFNENAPERIKKYGNDSRKISADVYIDDRNVGWLEQWSILISYVLTQYTMH